jgi:hypothetical protein
MAAPTTGQRKASPWVDSIRKQKEALAHLEGVMTQIGEQVILPAIARRLGASGIRRRSGELEAALTHRGAAGNVFLVRGNAITVGMTDALWRTRGHAIAGRGIVRARPGHWLRFVDQDTGRVVFAKSVRAVNPKYGIIGDMELTSAEQEQTSKIASEHFTGAWRLI